RPSSDGVTAAANHATEKARITAPEELEPEQLISVVEQTGYAARVPAPARSGRDDEPGPDPADTELTGLRHRLIGAVLLGVPVILLAMIPALQFTYWQWASLALAAPVVIWAGWPRSEEHTSELQSREK